jgi:hypothetical protein
MGSLDDHGMMGSPMGIHGDFMVILESQWVGLLRKNYRVDPQRNHGENLWFPDFPLSQSIEIGI